MPHDFINMQNHKKLNSQKRRVEWRFPGLEREGNGDMLIKGYKRSDMRWKSFGDLMYSMVSDKCVNSFDYDNY